MAAWQKSVFPDLYPFAFLATDFLRSPSSFSVAVKREGYPEDDSTQLDPGPDVGACAVTPAAHTITLLPPMVVDNLLPCDVQYHIKNTAVNGNLKAGKRIPLYTVSYHPNYTNKAVQECVGDNGKDGNNLDTLDCVCLQLFRTASSACNHNAVRHLI